MYSILYNPASGRSSDSLLHSIEDIITGRGSSYRVFYTDPVHGASIAAKDAMSISPEGIIVIGGDGTLSETICVMHESDIPLLILPCGTGNDFFRMLGLPKEPLRALEIQLDCMPRPIDIGRVNDSYFINVAGSGFDVNVLLHAEAHKSKHTGLLPYLLGLFDAIKDYKPIEADVTIDDKISFRSKNAILSIGNGRYFGGGMKAVPSALIDDGYFDFVSVAPVRKLMIYPLLVFYILGMHVKIGLGNVRKCRKVVISKQGMTVNIDGELKQMDTAEFEIIPKGLYIRCPLK